MKIKTSHTVTQEHEIKLPHYRSVPSGNYFYKVITENECIAVKVGSGPCCGIEVSYTSQAFLLDGNFETTKEAFDEAFKKQFDRLEKIKELELETTPI